MNFRMALPLMQDELILEPVECWPTRQARLSEAIHHGQQHKSMAAGLKVPEFFENSTDSTCQIFLIFCFQ